jgi:hypothetical protein
VGPAGSGRKAAAQAFAAALVSRMDRGMDGAAARAAAARIARGAHPDVHLVEPTPPESNPKGAPALRVDDIRELERVAALRPLEAPVKVFIVDGADKMTLATPQAFLKTLEEPPPHTVIILILTQARALPATVLSRCQIVRFLPATPEGALALLPDGRDEGRRRALELLTKAAAEGSAAILAGARPGAPRGGGGVVRRAGSGIAISSLRMPIRERRWCSPIAPRPFAPARRRYPWMRSWAGCAPAARRHRPSWAMCRLGSPSRCF